MFLICLTSIKNVRVLKIILKLQPRFRECNTYKSPKWQSILQPDNISRHCTEAWNWFSPYHMAAGAVCSWGRRDSSDSSISHLSADELCVQDIQRCEMNRWDWWNLTFQRDKGRLSDTYLWDICSRTSFRLWAPQHHFFVGHLLEHTAKWLYSACFSV